ncbi:MAG TPA: DUF86 domain-containing protein [Candidatus Nanoarchaeia archaeon]|nr:hypothetical protein [uncultured archaeon]AQS29568.1 hypothetical protein [uncultured archaeon]HLD55037.1 DUF86 domain-containing protein [Candidatus Nanoarchaeia archaeon]
MNKDPLIFIKHILENIDIIEEFSKNSSKQEIFKDKQKQYAIIRAIEIIGEAAKNLPNSFTKKYSEVNWKEIIGTRDKLIHQYFGIDLDIIWSIIKRDIPKLKKEIQGIIKKEKS